MNGTNARNCFPMFKMNNLIEKNQLEKEQAKIQNENLRALYLANISTTDTQTLICMIIRNALLEHLNNNN